MSVFFVACGVLSIPVICIYFYYSTLIAGLPDYKRLRQSNQRFAITNDNYKVSGNFSFVFLLPCLNEGKVIRNTINAILQLPYRNLLVVVIDDASDDDTADVVRSIRDRRVKLFQRVLPNARQGKGEALNACYQKIVRGASLLGINPDNVIVGVIDGDGRPSQNLLLEACEAFKNPSVGAAQSRVRISNSDKLLPLMQDLEFATQVGAIQNCREYLGSVGLGGNGQFTRLTALMSLGNKPWTKCLLEDFDIGLRLLLKGWNIRFLSESFVAQQGLTSVKRFIRQRARWVQGNMQCLRYTKSIVKANLPVTAKIDLLYFLCQPWMNILGSVTQLTAWILLLNSIRSGLFDYVVSSSTTTSLGVGILLWLTLVFGTGFLWAYIHFKSTEYDFKKFIAAGLFAPFYNLLVIPSVWLAFWRHITKKNSWAKTERIDEKPMSHLGVHIDVRV